MEAKTALLGSTVAGVVLNITQARAFRVSVGSMNLNLMFSSFGCTYMII